MSEDKVEKRESKRAFFTLEDNIRVTIQTHVESPVSLTVTLLSISAGGLSFFGPSPKLANIKKGDRLTVTDIKTPPPLGPIAAVEVEVKYIHNYEANLLILFGCVFTKASDALRNKIQNFVEYRLEILGLADKSISV